jgi:hypothetical protein
MAHIFHPSYKEKLKIEGSWSNMALAKKKWDSHLQNNQNTNG